MTLQSVLGCKVCSALEKQSVLRSKVFFDAKCALVTCTYVQFLGHCILDVKLYLFFPLLFGSLFEFSIN